MKQLWDYQHFYLVGIKGVAMTALAQCLLDAGKDVRGSDVAEEFVTQRILDHRQLLIDADFSVPLPAETDCVIYTAAHQAQDNPQVQAARQRGLPTWTHAEALGQLFNQHQGIAVCGVGGKSTTSAMITWILAQTGYQPNYAIGVGDIPGLDKTGQWQAGAKFFVAEADEYVTDPSAPSRGEPIQPRFAFLEPQVTVCTNLRHDHPDVYPSFADTQLTFSRFFDQVRPGGWLLLNWADRQSYQVMKYWSAPQQRQQLWFGIVSTAEWTADQTHPDFALIADSYQAVAGQTSARVVAPRYQLDTTLQLRLPGQFNLANALAAVAATTVIGVPPAAAVAALTGFRSTLRRSQWVGDKAGVKYYDDYAHHPDEVQQIIHAFREWYPDRRLVVAFQSHTFSRTRQFFAQFVAAFAEADQVVMIDIFPSAREAYDPSVSSTQLCQEIAARHPRLPAQNLGTLDQLAQFCQTQLHAGDVCLTVGAGDIYLVHDMIPAHPERKG